MLEKHNARLPAWLLRLRGEDRTEAIRARVESVLRSELLQFERFVLLEVLGLKEQAFGPYHFVVPGHLLTPYLIRRVIPDQLLLYFIFEALRLCGFRHGAQRGWLPGCHAA